MNQRKVSARYYLFEDLLWEMPSFESIKRIRPMNELQLFAALVWAREGKGSCPEVKARDHKDHSYYDHDGKRDIHLARAHRSVGGVLHELAHALGRRDKLMHGPSFRARCMRLYREYGGWSGVVDWNATEKGRKR